ncbi:MAG: HEPN domain-containing protein [Nanoarchaeota archaeon]
MPADDKLKKCLDEGARGGDRHQGLRRISPNQKLADAHVEKMLKNFQAITDFHDSGHSDWSASAAFYTLYHGLLAILAQRGYESRNQSCTFALIEALITKGEIKLLTIDDSKEIFDKDVSKDLAHSEKILDIRETMQYSTKTRLEEEEFQELKQRTRQLMEKIRQELERSNP